MRSNESPTLSLEEAAELLKCSPKTLRKMAAAGEVPAAKVGRAWVFSRAYLMEWVERLMAQNVKRP